MRQRGSKSTGGGAQALNRAFLSTTPRGKSTAVFPCGQMLLKQHIHARRFDDEDTAAFPFRRRGNVITADCTDCGSRRRARNPRGLLRFADFRGRPADVQADAAATGAYSTGAAAGSQARRPEPGRTGPELDRRPECECACGPELERARRGEWNRDSRSVQPDRRPRPHREGEQERGRHRIRRFGGRLLPRQGPHRQRRLLLHAARRQHRSLALHVRLAAGQSDHRGAQRAQTRGLDDRQPRARPRRRRLQASHRRNRRVHEGRLPVPRRERGRHGPVPWRQSDMDVGLRRPGRLHRCHRGRRALQAQPGRHGGVDVQRPDSQDQHDGQGAQRLRPGRRRDRHARRRRQEQLPEDGSVRRRDHGRRHACALQVLDGERGSGQQALGHSLRIVHRQPRQPADHLRQGGEKGCALRGQAHSRFGSGPMRREADDQADRRQGGGGFQGGRRQGGGHGLRLRFFPRRLLVERRDARSRFQPRHRVLARRPCRGLPSGDCDHERRQAGGHRRDQRRRAARRPRPVGERRHHLPSDLRRPALLQPAGVRDDHGRGFQEGPRAAVEDQPQYTEFPAHA